LEVGGDLFESNSHGGAMVSVVGAGGTARAARLGERQPKEKSLLQSG
jgi:shikimate 5-dehydrogenase